MTSGYFALSIAAMRYAIQSQATLPIVSQEPAVDAYARHEPHVLWICDQIEALNRKDPTDARIANRLIGYGMAVIEARRYWDRTWSQNLLEKDIDARNDREAGP